VADVAVAPDGTTTMDLWTNTEKSRRILQAVTLEDPAAVLTGSVWVAKPSGTGPVTIMLRMLFSFDLLDQFRPLLSYAAHDNHECMPSAPPNEIELYSASPTEVDVGAHSAEVVPPSLVVPYATKSSDVQAVVYNLSIHYHLYNTAANHEQIISISTTDEVTRNTHYCSGRPDLAKLFGNLEARVGGGTIVWP
jgi:hypothetical protein